jgi:hypothetical protein
MLAIAGWPYRSAAEIGMRPGPSLGDGHGRSVPARGAGRGYPGVSIVSGCDAYLDKRRMPRSSPSSVIGTMRCVMIWLITEID